MSYAGLYIHIPFCEHKCIYCDFYSIITKNGTADYLAALQTEMDYYAGADARGLQFDTIFFGGGTPTAMEPGYLAAILEQAHRKFKICADAEITMEANPGTVTPERLAEYRQTGINRISIGIQSFDPADLRFLTRIHDREQAIATVEAARKAGFDNINVDLIFNLPGQTREKWLDNVRQALVLPITHLSAYSLILERGTILNKMVLDGKVQMQDDDYDADLYAAAIAEITGRGFRQYEVSNFCRPGWECRHNLHYWQYDPYLGIGTSAHSFIGGRRWWNATALSQYCGAITQKRHAQIACEELQPEEQRDEFIMLALRSTGLNLKHAETRFGAGWYRQNEVLIAELLRTGMMTQNSDLIQLTAAGFAVCDEIVQRLISGTAEDDK